MYRYVVVINLARRGYCDAGVCMSVWLSVGMCLCICVSTAQYNFVKCGTIVTNILVGACTGTLQKGVLITGTTRNKGGGGLTTNYLVKRSQEQLLHTSSDISRFPLMVRNCHACVYYMETAVNSWYYLKTKLIINFSIPEGHNTRRPRLTFWHIFGPNSVESIYTWIARV